MIYMKEKISKLIYRISSTDRKYKESIVYWTCFLDFLFRGAQGDRNKMGVNPEHRWDGGRLETDAAGGLSGRAE